MLPTYYVCTACGERFEFSKREAVYVTSSNAAPLAGQLQSGDLLQVPVRPGWCKDCDKVTIVEDIAPLRDFENAYGAVRAGKAIEYPVDTTNMAAQDAQEAQAAVESYLRWRMGRQHAPRALCCGGIRYQFLDVATPLLKHHECEFGFIEGRSHIGGYNGPGPGVYSEANIPVYSSEGVLIGRLTWRERGSDVWQVVPDEYPA